MLSHKARTLLSLAAVLAVAGMIFFFSSQNGEESSTLSGSISRFVLSVLVPDYESLTPEEQAPYLEAWGYAIRKIAHFSEYALLAVSLVNFLHTANSRWRLAWVVLLAWVIATVYAGGDEWHQTFVSARVGAYTDVMIDSAGTLTGALLMALILWIHLRKRRSHKP